MLFRGSDLFLIDEHDAQDHGQHGDDCSNDDRRQNVRDALFAGTQIHTVGECCGQELLYLIGNADDGHCEIHAEGADRDLNAC